MDMKKFLEELSQNSNDIANKGQQYAEQKLNIPQQGEERDAALSGMKKGAMAAGVLALLVGTNAGRTVSGNVLKLGSLAAVGTLAWKAYENWLNKSPEQAQQQVALPPALPVSQLEGKDEGDRSVILLKAMIAAAKADGVVDDNEEKIIEEQIARMGFDAELKDVLQNSLIAPLSAKSVAELAKGDVEVASEIYLVSSAVAKKDNIQEKLYLESLAKELGISNELVAELELATQEVA